MSDKQKVQLSKSILDMKFMKRTKEKVEKDKEDEEGRAMYSNEITEAMRRSGNVVFIETNLTSCKNLADGRLSFGGMNPAIESLMTDYYSKINEGEKKKEKDVSDVEMAKGYSTVVATISNKFNKKKGRSKQFQKPKDDY